MMADWPMADGRNKPSNYVFCISTVVNIETLRLTAIGHRPFGHRQNEMTTHKKGWPDPKTSQPSILH